jgi:hypothetical protein
MSTSLSAAYKADLADNHASEHKGVTVGMTAIFDNPAMQYHCKKYHVIITYLGEEPSDAAFQAADELMSAASAQGPLIAKPYALEMFGRDENIPVIVVRFQDPLVTDMFTAFHAVWGVCPPGMAAKLDEPTFYIIFSPSFPFPRCVEDFCKDLRMWIDPDATILCSDIYLKRLGGVTKFARRSMLTHDP